MSYYGSRNIGEFEMNMDTIEQEPELVLDIFSKMKFIPTHAEMLWGKGVVVYQGISKIFKDNDVGKPVPFYEIKLEMGEEGLIGVSADLEQTRQLNIVLNGAGYSRDDVRELVDIINLEIG